MKKRSMFPGVILIFFGVILLVDKMELDFYIMDRDILFPLLFVVLGLYLWTRALNSERKGKVFLGTFFLVQGLFFLVWNLGFLDYYFYSNDYWPIYFIAFGLSFLSLFLVNARNWFALFPAALFLFIGTISTMYILGYVDQWTIENYYYDFRDMTEGFDEFILPAILVLVGLIFIVKSLNKKSRKNDESIHGPNHNPDQNTKLPMEE